MLNKKYSGAHVIIREDYGWKYYQNNNAKLWFCGYVYDFSIDELIIKMTYIIDNNLENNILLDWIGSLCGHFSFIFESNSSIIASVDKICSIPLFFSKKNDLILISNHAPLLKKRIKLNSVNINKLAKLEIAMSGYTIGSKTLYSDIERIESGECLIYRQSLLNRVRYYTYSPWKTVVKTKSQLQDEFLNVCLTAFKKIKDNVGNRQIVVPLSAGNDSRLIVSGLKEVGVKNVVCFSYGRKGNFETPVSKSVAKKLGYRWIYIQDRLKDKRQFFQSEVYQKYVEAFESFSCNPNVQEVYEVFLLKKTNLVDNNAIIINGSCGDFISGGHIRPISDIKFSQKTIGEINWNKFLNKHYSLWRDLRNSTNDSNIVSELENTLSSRIIEFSNFEERHYAIMEHAEFVGRQSKYIMGQQRTYEYFGYEWRMPLWSDEMLNFWESVPYKYKIDQYLYLETLYKNNWGGVWLDIKVNNKIIYPVSLRWLRTLLKILFIPLGRSRWHRFEKNVLEYFLHTTYAITVAPYLSVLFDRRGYRGANSWLAHQMIQSIKE
jgi:asparagine synthase (glutamine-hydrolysing)